MERHARGSARDHEKVSNAQMPKLDGEEMPNVEPQWDAGILHVPQHSRDAHDGQANPEEIEKAMEVLVVTFWVEVRDARGKLDGGEDSTFLLGASLLASG